MARDLRADAARVIANVLDGSSLNQALPPALEQLEGRDRALLQQLCYGTIREGPRLEALLDVMLDKPLRARDGDVRGLLLCGLYQLGSTRIPDHAAVSSTVDATRSLGKGWARGMTNALLRRFLREGEKLLNDLDEAARRAHPPWIYRAIRRQWPEQSETIIEANNSQPPMTLRVNTSRVSLEDYRAQLQAVDIESRAGDLAPQSLTLEQPMDVGKLPGFDRGLVSVQDEAAQLAAILLAARPGDRVLDACAAPGGKTCHILELESGLAAMVAIDSDQRRVVKIQENLARLSLAAEVLCADAANPPAELMPDSFDRILVDAPCSATGVIRRHPDIKLLRREADIPALAASQLKILQGVWPLLRPGGTLLYATCSLLAEENDNVVDAFLADTASATGADTKVTWGIATSHGRQLLPSPGGSDGLYYALIHKTA